MRDIKFRGFCEHGNGEIVISVNGEKCKGEWIYGDLITYENETVSIRQPKTWFRQNVISKTVGQFTDLKDKNDKEIYEGDIVHTADGSVVATIKIGECYPEPVKYCCELCGIKKHTVHCLHAYDKNGEYLIEDNKSLEIIGNMFGNPELLEENNENNNN